MKHIGKSRVFLVLQNYIVNRKKGTPTMAEEKETKKVEDIFYYDWLNDDENN